MVNDGEPAASTASTASTGGAVVTSHGVSERFGAMRWSRRQARWRLLPAFAHGGGAQLAADQPGLRGRLGQGHRAPAGWQGEAAGHGEPGIELVSMKMTC